MKYKEIQSRLERGYTMAIYGTRENIHEQMTNDIKELLEAVNFAHSSLQLKEKEVLNFEEYKNKWFEQENDIIYIDKLTKEFLDINDIINKYQEYKLNL